MTASVVSEPQQEATARPPRRRRWVWLLGGLVAVVVAFGLALFIGLVLFHAQEGRPLPRFVSLAEHPDSSLHGTVAYSVGDCVRIVAAAGQPSKDVLCTGPSRQTAEEAMKNGKEVGLQLVWARDGHLEVTMVRMEVGKQTRGQAPNYNAEWQKVVDVRTGRVDDVAPAEFAAVPNRTTWPSVSPDGRRLTWTSESATGRAKVTLTDSRGTRTLLSVHGPGEYTYGIQRAFWAPNWEWIAADDSRVLVITPGDPAVTRILVTPSEGAGITDFPTFAVTADDILTPSA